MIKKYVIFFLLAFPTLLLATTTNSTENQISHYIDTQQQNQISLLKKLVNINSGTAHLSGVHKIGELLRPQFEALGFKVYWKEEPTAMKRAGTLIAEHPGQNGKRLLLIGHLDTVFPQDSPFQHFTLHNHFASGPGVTDDKGGDVVILYALKALQAAHALENASITVVLTGDEEDSGKPTTLSRKPLIDLAHQSDIALDFEPAITLNTATIARRGISDWMINSTGEESHSSQIFKPYASFGAIFELTRIIDKLRMTFYRERYVTFNPGIILGGTRLDFDESTSKGKAFGKSNVIAKIAMAKGDFRFLTPQEKENAENKMITVVNQHLPGTHSTIVFYDGIPSMPPTAANLNLLKEYSEASEILGYGKIKPLDPGSRGAGDISHIASMVSSALAGLGPAGEGEHSTKEILDLRSLPIQTKRAAILMLWETQEKK